MPEARGWYLVVGIEWKTCDMYLGFVDESYNADFMFTSCAVATEEQWQRVSTGFAAIRSENASKHGVPVDSELHGHEIMGGAGDWKILRGQHHVSSAIYLRALETMSDAGVKVLIRGVDIGRLNARYRYPQPPYVLALQFTLERLNEHMVSRCEGHEVQVTADDVHTRTEHVKQFSIYQSDGTPWYRASNLECVSSLKYGDSRALDGLQAADLAVYLYRRRYGVVFEHEPEHPRAKKIRKRLYSALAPMLLPQTGVWHP